MVSLDALDAAHIRLQLWVAMDVREYVHLSVGAGAGDQIGHIAGVGGTPVNRHEVGREHRCTCEWLYSE